jgi:hypothetical protein
LRQRPVKAIVGSGDRVFTRYLTRQDSIPMVRTAHDVDSAATAALGPRCPAGLTAHRLRLAA